MALTCFDNIIGVKELCEVTAPDSGIYLDELGVHRVEIEKYFAEPYQNAQLFFEDMRRNAINEVKSKINSSFMHKYVMRSVVDNTGIGNPAEDMDLNNGAAGKSRGLEILTTMNRSQLNFFVSRIALFTDYTGSVDVKVYDLQQDKLLDTIAVDCVAGQISSKYINKSYAIDRRNMTLAFLYETDSVNNYQVNLDGNGCSSCDSIVGYARSSAYASVRGVEFTTADAKISSNATTVGHASGMILDYNISCNHEAWLCGISNVLAYPIALRTAINILNYGKDNSERLNSRTMIDTEKIKLRVDLMEFNFGQAWDGIIQYINVPEDVLCFDCKRNTIYKLTADR